MNWLGYGSDIRQARRDAYRESGRLRTKWWQGLALILVSGSKGEGLSCYLESDTDVMMVNNTVICLEESVKSSNSVPRVMTVLRSCRRASYPGHCRMFLERRGTMIPSGVENALCDDGNGREIFSSDLYINSTSDFKVLGAAKHERAGPSIPVTIKGVFHVDLVHALRYFCPSILERWESRLRFWPPPDVVQKVQSQGAFLTPVGFKGSACKYNEWRMCFNIGEKELVNNLNDTQVKLYVLLKMVIKDVLKPCHKEVTSYTVKNIVFWIAERNPNIWFNERRLFYWLYEGLGALKVALATKELAYYMIPERNLMAACGLEYEQQSSWISTITDMINEGPKLILRLPKIRQALLPHPEPIRWFSARRMELEMLELMIVNRGLFLRNKRLADETDIMLQAMKMRKFEICREVVMRMSMEGSRNNVESDVWKNMLK
ncbi:hypothetical protein DPMN_117633 [Dreissena polymorpha]|uniref:Mab-21-like nucleotidyltransferase domain-containing protein n=2 Tax=Dreissena polymorpha TaxID=45954 RepID=A0A9D4JMS3_DREPO|nr:hypothetical protein DPMN_117633 [Dreissena polymorpha]